MEFNVVKPKKKSKNKIAKHKAIKIYREKNTWYAITKNKKYKVYPQNLKQAISLKLDNIKLHPTVKNDYYKDKEHKYILSIENYKNKDANGKKYINAYWDIYYDSMTIHKYKIENDILYIDKSELI
jgi:hypothetical protein